MKWWPAWPGMSACHLRPLSPPLLAQDQAPSAAQPVGFLDHARFLMMSWSSACDRSITIGPMPQLLALALELGW